jgi:hypothetical protein
MFFRSTISRHSFALAAAMGAAALPYVISSCSGDEASTTTSGAGGGGASSHGPTTGGGSPTSTGSSTGGGLGGGTAGSGGIGTGGLGGAGGGVGGEGGYAGAWPTCDAQPPATPAKALHDIWQDNPSAPTPVWIPGVYVTAVSQGACVAGTACQVYLQQDETYASLAAGAQRALKLLVSKNTSQFFTTLKLGDQVNVYANAWRYNLDGQNELLLQVNLMLKGCAKVVGSGNPTPVAATLADLTVPAYEDTLGPLLVQVQTISGKPKMPGEIFALWNTGVFSDAGLDEVVNLSPYFLPGGVFAGLQQGAIHDFTSVTGVFGLFVPPTPPIIKYKVVYPRTMSEVVVGQVH